MDDRMLDSICERLKSVLNIKGSCLLREGAPVDEMLLVIRGQLNSHTTNGGRSGFFNTCCLGPGDFCGEELLTWAMVPHPNVILPSSTRTVKCISEVEALSLTAEDLKFVASQFRRLHWKQLRPTFRSSSHQWRTWAACFIQASWRSYKKRSALTEISNSSTVSAPPRSCSSFRMPAGRGVGLQMDRRWHSCEEFDDFRMPQKPSELDFLVDVNE